MKSTVEVGSAYEDFVEKIFHAINILGEREGTHGTINLQRNVKLESQYGLQREVDIYWEYEILGITFKAAIECKNYNSNIPVEKIEAFANKIKSLGISKGIFATRKGFQSGAVAVAKAENISLIVVRDVEDEDFEGLARIFCVNINVELPSRITKFSPAFDFDWLINNTDFREGQQIKIAELNSEIFINDLDAGERTSMHQIESTLPRKDPGQYLIENKYSNAFLEFDGNKYKLRKITLEYTAYGCLAHNFSIDVKDFVLGVLVYINEEKEKLLVKKPV